MLGEFGKFGRVGGLLLLVLVDGALKHYAVLFEGGQVLKHEGYLLLEVGEHEEVVFELAAEF